MKLSRTVVFSALALVVAFVAVSPTGLSVQQEPGINPGENDPEEVTPGTTVKLKADIWDNQCNLSHVEWEHVNPDGLHHEASVSDSALDECEDTVRWEHTLSEEGQHEIEIFVYDDDGYLDSWDWEIEARPPPPKACFSLDPSKGQVGTTFKAQDLDCSTDKDTPDSDLEYRVRWGDGSGWSFWKSLSRDSSNDYDSGGKKTVKVQVRDPYGSTDKASKTATVDGIPRPAFDVNPDNGHEDTEFQFDASPSEDHPTRSSALEYRWDWTNDGTYDTLWSGDETATHTYGSKGDYQAKLQVRDERDQTETTTKTIPVTKRPDACFEVRPRSGTKETAFKVDASCSRDPETATSNIRVRWNWTDDGSWDTGWSTEKEATHSFGSRGVKTIGLQVEDGEGLRATTTKKVLVAVEQELPPLPRRTLFPRQDIQVDLPGPTPVADCVRVVTGKVVFDGPEIRRDPTRGLLLVPDGQVYIQC